MKKENLLKMLALLELLAVIIVVLKDIFLPTIVIIGIGFVCLMIRQEKFSSLGFKLEGNFLKMVLKVFGLAVIWTLLDFALFLPLLNHLTGTTQNLSSFAELKGNSGLLMILLVISWTLAAFGEEFAYRGFLQNRITGLFANQTIGIMASVLLSSVLFGFAHTEQGIIGITITTIDALFFSYVKYRYKNLWASVFAHGFINSIGIITFYFTGPLYGLW